MILILNFYEARLFIYVKIIIFFITSATLRRSKHTSKIRLKPSPDRNKTRLNSSSDSWNSPIYVTGANYISRFGNEHVRFSEIASENYINSIKKERSVSST